MSRKNSIIGLFEPEKKLKFLVFLYLCTFKISCSAELSMEKFYNFEDWASDKVDRVDRGSGDYSEMPFRSPKSCVVTLYVVNKAVLEATVLLYNKRSRIAQSVACLTQEPGVPCSLPSPATLSFLLSLIQAGQLLATGKGMYTKYWLTA